MEEKRKEEIFRGFDDDILDDKDFDEVDDEGSKENEDDNSESKETKSETTSTDSEEGSEVKGTDDETDDGAESKKLEAERNAEFAKRRRAKEEAEKKEREAKEAKIKEQARIEAELGVLKKNPYNDQPIVDKEDLEIYKIMKTIEDEGGDPIEDFPKKQAQLNRERSQRERVREEQEVARTQKIQRETQELRDAYPNLNLSELAQDKEYLDLCSEKGERWTMVEIYEHLISQREKKKSFSQEKAKTKVVNEKVKQHTKTPSSATNGTSHEDDYLEMSDEEFLERTKDSRDFF